MIGIGRILDENGEEIPVTKIESPTDQLFSWLTLRIRQEYETRIFIACDRTLVVSDLPPSFLDLLVSHGFSVNAVKKTWRETVAGAFRRFFLLLSP